LRNNDAYKYSNLFLVVELNYPNGKVIKDTLEYSVYNVYGSKVIEGSEDDLFENSAILDLSTLTSGVYFLEITDGEFLEKHQLVRK